MISFFDCLFVGALALVVLYFWLTWNHNHWKKKGIDSDEKPSILFGSMTDAILGKKPMGELFHKLYMKFPNQRVIGWYKFRHPAILIRDPELIRKVLVSDFNYFRNNDVELDPEVDPIMGSNIFVLRDEMWKKGRALVTPAFTAGKIKAIFPIMKGVAEDLVEYLKQHPEELHVKETMSRYTSEIVARCAFGIEGNNLKDLKPEMHEMGKLIFETSWIKSLKMMSFILMPKLPKLLKLKMVPDKVIQFFEFVLKDVISHRQENNIERNDLVQYLIEVKRKSLEVAKGNAQSDTVTKIYTDNDILSGCIMFFLEGYETSALILNNILYYLGMNEEIQDKLRKEVDETLGEGELTFEKLHSMNYLHSVFAESNRILPAAFAMQKVCTETYEMDVGNEKPLIIEKGTSVVLPVYSLHNDPLYWEQPDLFKPERFSEKEEANAKARGVYIPFSDGPRICPGSRIATTIVKVAVVYILSQLEVIPTSRTPKKFEPDPHFFMIAHKGGIFLKFAERSR